MIDQSQVAAITTPLILVGGASWRWVSARLDRDRKVILDELAAIKASVQGTEIKVDVRLTALELAQATLGGRVEGIIAGKAFWTPSEK